MINDLSKLAIAKAHCGRCTFERVTYLCIYRIIFCLDIRKEKAMENKKLSTITHKWSVIYTLLCVRHFYRRKKKEKKVNLLRNIYIL